MKSSKSNSKISVVMKIIFEASKTRFQQRPLNTLSKFRRFWAKNKGEQKAYNMPFETIMRAITGGSSNSLTQTFPLEPEFSSRNRWKRLVSQSILTWAMAMGIIEFRSKVLPTRMLGNY